MKKLIRFVVWRSSPAATTATGAQCAARAAVMTQPLSRGDVVDTVRRHRHARSGEDRRGRHAGFRRGPGAPRRLQLDREEGAGHRPARSAADPDADRAADANVSARRPTSSAWRWRSRMPSRSSIARKQMSDKQLIPQTELETAEVNVQSAEAQIKSSEASLTQAQAQLNNQESTSATRPSPRRSTASSSRATSTRDRPSRPA